MEITKNEILELYKSGGTKAVVEKCQCSIPTARKYIKQAEEETHIKPKSAVK